MEKFHVASFRALQLLQAMAMGLPVISTNWSGIQAYLDESVGYPIKVLCVQTVNARARQAKLPFLSLSFDVFQSSGKSDKSSPTDSFNVPKPSGLLTADPRTLNLELRA